jgi:ATP/maltotriose-dependent transcriptional regulator MalT/DNA-binding SARP family transcriptional activator
MRRSSVAWIAGAPGSGKTTLVSSYLTERGLGGLWIQLGPDDADIATFFFYLGQAVDHAATRSGPSLPTLLPEFMPSLTSFTRQCAATIALRIDRPAVIVLDNYEQIPIDAPLHEVVRELAATIPAGVSLMILSRSDPPPPYARLRLHGELSMLEPQELSLTQDEAVAVVAEREPHRVGAAVGARADQLMRQTEGWFAGFTLLLTESRDTDLPGPRAGTKQLLFDYFATELFEQLDPAMQDALLCTALLPTMAAADAERVCGHAAIARMLAELHRRNCFVVQRGVTEPQYEYHALFRAFLLDRASARLSPDEWRALQRRSADVLVRTGQVDAAAPLYRAARDWPALCGLVLREAAALIATGRHRTLENWLVDLPDDVARGFPWLLHWQAVARQPFDPVAARGLFEQAYEGFQRAQDVVGLYTAWAGVMESFFFEWRDFRLADRWITKFEALRAHHPEFPSRAVELRTYCAMGTLLHRAPQHPMLPAWADRAMALLDPAYRDASALLGGYLIIWFLWRGNASEARAIVDRVTPWAGPDTAPMVRILWLCATGFYHSVRGDTESCRCSIDAGLAIAEQSGLHRFDFLLAAQIARCSLVAGEPDAAEVWIAKMSAAMRSHSHIDGAFFQHLLCHAAAQRGSWELALDHGRGAMAMAIESGVPFVVATCHIAMARAHIGHGDADEAAGFIEAARLIGRSMQSQVVECLCLEIEARAALDQGKQELALERLAGSLALSRAMDGATWNVVGPEANAGLYELALAAGIEVEHVRRLIRRLQVAAPEAALAGSSWPWPIRIYSLGRFDVVIDDQPLRSSGKPQHKPLELLKCLCAFGGSAVNQDRLIDALWPDAEGDAGEQAFRTTLHRLRKLLRYDQAIRLEDRHVHLDVRWLWVDSLSFDRAAHLPRVDDKASLHGILARYRGHFLNDESALWAITFRARLRAQFMTLSERLGALLERDEDWHGAVRCYLHVIEIDPAAEAFYRRLMAAYGRLGNRSEAMSVYQRCRQTLLARQGVSPAPETQALYQQLIGH